MNINLFSRTNCQQILDRLSNEEVRFLKILAFILYPVDEQVIFLLTKHLNQEKKELIAILNMLEKNELITTHEKAFSHQKKEYELHPGLITELYIRAAKDTSRAITQNERLASLFQWTHNSDKNSALKNRKCLLSFLTKGDVQPLDFRKHFWHDHDWPALILSWFKFEELTPLLQQLPEELTSMLFDKFFEDFTDLLIDRTKEFDLLVSNNPYLNSDLKESLENDLILTKYIFTGELKKASEKMNISTYGGVLASAFLQQADGKFEEAVLLYEKAHKNFPGSFPTNIPFYDFCYVAALVRCNTEKSKKKLVTLSKKREINDSSSDNMVLSALIDIATNINYDKKGNPKFKIIARTPITHVLGEYLLCHYNLKNSNNPDFKYPKYFKNKDAFKIFQFILSSDFDEYKPLYNKLKSEIGCEDILPPFHKVELWERTLDKLIQDKKVSKKTNTLPQKGPTDRIIYLIDKWNNIKPKLQKSKDGLKWSKGRNISLQTFSSGMDEFSEFDKEMQSMVEVHKSYSGYGYPSYEYSLSYVSAFKKLAGHPLVFMEENPDVAMDIFIEQPHISIRKKGANFLIESNVVNAANQNLDYIEHESNTRIRIMTMTSRQRDIIAMLTEVGKFPVAAEEKLRELIKLLSSEITIHSDLIASDEEITQIKGDSSIVIQLLPVGSQFKASIYIKPFVNTPPYCIPNQGTKSVMGEIDGIPHQALRNFSKEKANLSLVLDTLEEYELNNENIIYINDAEECLKLLELIQPLEQVRIEWPEGVKVKLKGGAEISGLSVNLKKKSGWFEMIGELKYNDDQTLSLHEIMERMDQTGNNRFIALGNDEYLSLSDELRKAINAIRSMSVKESKGGLRISEFSVPFLHAIENEGISVEADSSYKSLLKRINDAEKNTVKTPASLQASLREYQEDGFRWMVRLCAWGSGACLADDMGLGKTVQSIAMLLHEASGGPSLIVAPASVIQNWQQELLRFAPSLQVAVLNTEGNREEVIRNAADFDIVITTYGLLVTEEDELAKKLWRCIVLDEAHTIKNKETKMSKSAMNLQGNFRLLLTGTPVQNHLSEIWNLFQFMNPGMLGSFEHFNKNFITPIEVNHNEEKRKELKQLIAPFLLRRTKNEVLNELPGKTEIIIPVELNAKEELVYEMTRKKAEEGLLQSEANTVQTLAEITRLRQAASHISLVDKKYKARSSKLEAFFDLYNVMIENNHRALVFSQFTSHLALLKEELDKKGIEYLYLDGSTPTAERGKLVKKFQTGNQPLFLISLKAGGLGLNLTAADFVVHMDPWWNPAIEDQASDRAYRIGQKRPVTVYRLISTNTIEEKIIELHRTKKDLADSLLDGTNKSHKLSREDLLNLLRR